MEIKDQEQNKKAVWHNDLHGSTRSEIFNDKEDYNDIS